MPNSDNAPYAFQWDPSKENQEPLLRRAPNTKPYVILHGIPTMVGRFMYEGKVVPLLPDGSFILKVPVNSDQVQFSFQFTDLQGRSEQETYSLVFEKGPNWKSFMEALKQDNVSNPWTFIPGFGFTYATYKQPNLRITEWLFALKGAATYQFSDKWLVLGQMFYTIHPLEPIQTQQILFFGSNIDLRYTVTFPNTDFEVFLMGGWYYNTTVSIPAEIGYRDVYGPQIFPVIRKSIFGHNLSLFFKFSPVMDKNLFYSLASAEIVVGAAFDVSKTISITSSMTHLNLNMENDAKVQSTYYTLGMNYVIKD